MASYAKEIYLLVHFDCFLNSISKTKKHYRWFPWNALSVSSFFSPHILKWELKKELPLSTKGKKAVQKYLTLSIKAKGRSTSALQLTMSNGSCLKKGKHVMIHLPQSAFLASVNMLFCILKGSAQGYFFHEFL